MKINEIIKWIAVSFMMMAAMNASLKLSTMAISFIMFLIGHIIMTTIFLINRDIPLFTMNMIWGIIDIIGIIQWI